MLGRHLLLAHLALLLACASRDPAPNLFLLVTVDTLRADYLGAYGSERGLTPSLDRLAAESVVFTAAYAPASFTFPSLSTLFTGRYPDELGITSNESALPEGVPTLATELSARGWRTAAVVSNFVLRDACGLAAGFDVYDDTFTRREVTRRWPERAAGDTTDAALETLDACSEGGGQRCFLWAHYQDPHGPYTPPEGGRERWLAAERAAPGGTRRLEVNADHSGVGGIPRYQAMQGEREAAFYLAGYAAEVHYLDAEVGRLLEAVEERGLAERAIVVFAADHGEGLGEGDYWFAHGEYLSDPLVRVPLLVRLPSGPVGTRDDLVAMVDLFPSLLGLLAEPASEADYLGRDLLADGAEEGDSTAYIANLAGGKTLRYGLIEPEFKFVTSEREGVWDGWLVRRGREGVDLTAAAPQVAARMRRDLLRFRKLVDRGRSETRQELSEAEREQLRALGYVD